MDLFHAMRVFNKVVETNSFSLAADSLGLPRASVTTTIQALEKHLQVRLLNRTTRKLVSHRMAPYIMIGQPVF